MVNVNTNFRMNSYVHLKLSNDDLLGTLEMMYSNWLNKNNYPFCRH